ncbi:MAG: hypothetical protein LBR95_02165 [Azoarcus sp.]|jgi:mRNA-degrading endonuclease RelE of RelBE toxin-antitoxin system|nr:hypothetical protein [Azoarcus sp.]
MFIDIHEHAKQDIKTIRAKNVNAAATILTVLEQIEADPLAIDKLTTHGNNTFDEHNINVKQWQTMKRKGNLWRFRVLDTPATKYRIIYGYHYQTRQICVLAVVEKGEFNYDDTTSNLAKRIISDWRNI